MPGSNARLSKRPSCRRRANLVHAVVGIGQCNGLFRQRSVRDARRPLSRYYLRNKGLREHGAAGPGPPGYWRSDAVRWKQLLRRWAAKPCASKLSAASRAGYLEGRWSPPSRGPARRLSDALRSAWWSCIVTLPGRRELKTHDEVALYSTREMRAATPVIGFLICRALATDATFSEAAFRGSCAGSPIGRR
jgi:hypothetical protein